MHRVITVVPMLRSTVETQPRVAATCASKEVGTPRYAASRTPSRPPII